MALLVLDFTIFCCLQAHLVECKFKKVQCGVCSEFVFLSYLDQHKKEECPLREINCDYCNAVVVARELQVILTCGVWWLVYQTPFSATSKTHFGCCQLFPVKCKQCQKTVPRKQVSHMVDHVINDVIYNCGDLRDMNIVMNFVL